MLHGKHSSRMQTSTVSLYWEGYHAAMGALKAWLLLSLPWPLVLLSCPRTLSLWTGRNCPCHSTLHFHFELNDLLPELAVHDVLFPIISSVGKVIYLPLNKVAEMRGSCILFMGPPVG